MVGHLNSFLARGGGNLNKNFPKIQMPGGCPGGMLKLRFDWYIIFMTTLALKTDVRHVPTGASYDRTKRRRGINKAKYQNL